MPFFINPEALALIMIQNILKLSVITAAALCFLPYRVSTAQNIPTGKIVVIAGNHYANVIYTVNPDGTSMKELYRIPDDGKEEISRVVWSPDFNYLLITLYERWPAQGPSGYSAHLINADGTNLRPLPNIDVYSVRWSPDSKYLTYLCNLCFTLEHHRYDSLIIANADGSDAKRFINREVVSYAWSSDSMQLAIASLGDIYTVPLSDPDNLSRLAVNETKPTQVE